MGEKGHETNTLEVGVTVRLFYYMCERSSFFAHSHVFCVFCLFCFVLFFPRLLLLLLSGDIFHNSPYQFYMKQNETCAVLCQTMLQASSKRYKKLLEAADTQPSYRVQVRIDNMPAIMMESLSDGSSEDEESEVLVAIGKGFPLTTMYDAGSEDEEEGSKIVYALTNHVNFFILYHALDSSQILSSAFPSMSTEPTIVNRIIRVYVTSRSIDYSQLPGGSAHTGDALDCNYPGNDVPLLIEDDTEVTYTYSVKWIETDEQWATRWDELLEMTPEDYEMNWFAIVNSIAITTMLSFAVAVILLRAIKRDFVLYNELDAQLQDEESAESEVFVTGWKVVARDVFRPPRFPLLLSIIAGTGDQLFWVLATIVSVALFGLFSPSNRGALMSATFFLYALLGFPAGYAAATMYKKLNGTARRSSVVGGTALLLPGSFFLIFMVTDIILWSSDSTGAVPLSTMLYVALLWFGVSVPLVFLGASRGFRTEIPAWPCKTNAIPRQVPPKVWYFSTPVMALVGGGITFAVAFVQVFYVFSRMWLHEFVYMFGFIFITLVLWIISSAEVAVVATYLTLCLEDHRWWWKAVLVPASFGAFMFVMSIVYFLGIMPSTVTTMLFISYSFMASVVLSVVAGSIGLEVSLYFVVRIFSEVKLD